MKKNNFQTWLKKDMSFHLHFSNIFTHDIQVFKDFPVSQFYTCIVYCQTKFINMFMAHFTKSRNPVLES